MMLQKSKSMALAHLQGHDGLLKGTCLAFVGSWIDAGAGAI